MSGHSKWNSIKHQKGVADARRGQLFSNPDTNFRLRLSVQKARDSNMPMDNIERSIKKGSGDLEGIILTELVLEGYGPSGIAILVEALTDNRNRTIQDVRSTFTKHGGSLGENGCVSWIFDAKGLISVKAAGLDADDLALNAIDAGADDVKIEDDYVEIYTMPEDLLTVRSALETKNIPIASAELLKVPKTMVQLEDKAALQTMKLLEKLEEIDEMQHVYSNADFPDAVLEQYQLQASG